MDEQRDTEFMKLTVQLSGKSYHQDLKDDLQINADNINESYIDQPSKFAWWAVLAAQARAKADRLKFLADKQDEYVRKTLTGELDIEVRKELELNGEKVTEGRVTSGIYNNKKYKDAVDTLNNLRESVVQANEDASILETAKEAMDQRKEMLISLGAQLRMDLSNVELSMKKNLAAEVMKNKKI